MHAARCMCSTAPLPAVHTAKELRPGTPGSRMGHGSWVIGMAWQKTLTCHCYSLHMLHTPPHHHGTTNRSDSIDRLDRPSISCFAFWLFEMVRRTKDSQNGMCPFLHKMPSNLNRPARIALRSIRTTRSFCHKPFASKRRYATTKRRQSLSTALSRYHAHSPSFSPCLRFSNPHVTHIPYRV